MKTGIKRRLHTVETALLLSLCITLCLAVWGQGGSRTLSSQLIRLHVIAVSDEPEEQELKLRVRDAVLAYAEPLLENTETAEDAYALLYNNLDSLSEAAQSASEGRSVEVTLTRETYPTRYYDSFALPAGEYNSLRVMLGEAQGKNWWCVIFPPLCTAASVEDVQPTLSEDEQKIITQDGEGYVLRFRAMELWGELREMLGS
ncbi:MAG: stage II sporulation protein R [Oscillospiraceae bacterium]